ncbi:MAG: hypothetical protein NUV32_03985 [Exilispira sp.]|jgi:tetratricopeptide (TPR) repeat protein|nr:hypothetical protein [Exilispira sp.]
MSQKILNEINTEKEEIFYFLLDILPSVRTNNEIAKFWNLFKGNPSTFHNSHKIPNSISKMESLVLFFKFYQALYLEEKNKAILYIENFVNNEVFDEFYLLSVLFGIKENLDVQSYFEIDDQYFSNLLKTYYFIKLNDFDKAYNILIEINSINRLSLLKEIFYLQCAIEKGLYEESENIFTFLLEINKNNNPLKKLYVYYLIRKGQILEAQKYLAKNKIKINTIKDRTLFLYNLLETKQFDKAISFLKKEGKTDEEFFLLARLYHVIGLLDEAFNIYDKLDDTKFAVNKMKGIIYFQLGKMDKALLAFNEEISKRYVDTDILKIIKFLKIKKRWNNA